MLSIFHRCLNEKFCTLSGGGFLGIFIGFLCPLCVPASAAFFASIGLSFLPHARIIYPLIGVFSAIFVYGLFAGLRRHGDVMPLLFGLLGICALPLGRYVIGSPILTYTGAFVIIAASVWNSLLQNHVVQTMIAKTQVAPSTVS